jgi:hypothetical protein
MDDFRQVSTGGLRNEKPLTGEQKGQVKTYAISLGMPEYKIYFTNDSLTRYGLDLDFLIVGTDVLPLDGRVRNPNTNLSWKCAIAHEVVGHRDANLKNWTLPDELLDDVQASIRAARFTPDLSDTERCDLIKDAIYRLHKRSKLLRPIKHLLHIDRR